MSHTVCPNRWSRHVCNSGSQVLTRITASKRDRGEQPSDKTGRLYPHINVWSSINSLCYRHAQLLDVFSHKANLNLVLEYLDTDLEAVIKDRTLIFQAADIKSWMAMTFKGLEFCHRNWVLHRVSILKFLSLHFLSVVRSADYDGALADIIWGKKHVCIS